MSLKHGFGRGFAALALVLAMVVSAIADTVRLKDGSIIKGKIISFGGGKFVVAVGEGSRRRELVYAAGEVESITFDDRAADANRQISYVPSPQSEPVATVPKVVVKGDGAEPARSTPAKPGVKPIELHVKVLADNTANGWTNTGWVVKKGQRIRIEGDGRVSLGRGQSSPPGGLPDLEDQQKLLKGVPTGALVAVIGDDNNDFIYIGASREFVATRDGALFLGINEGNLNDNSGFFNVKVEIIPDGE
jgi:hypothetical protein